MASTDREWVTFTDERKSPSGKTSTWVVIGSGGPADRLGTVVWHGAWRCYVFTADTRAIYNAECMRQIAAFLAEQTERQRAAAKARKV